MIASRMALRCPYAAGLILLHLLLPAQAGLKPVDPGELFLRPDREAVVHWALQQENPNAAVEFAVSDYWGKAVLSSKAVSRDGRRIDTPLELPQGYYEIAFPQQNQRFGICVLPERSGPADPFFCIDAALSWLELREDARDALARILDRVGIGVSRERLGWGAVHQASEQWDWQTDRKYEAIRQIYARHRVKILEMFHDAPAWMGATEANPYPADLFAAARSWAEIERRWRPYWAALEVWNEPDIQFGKHLPADQYVPVAKAVAFAVRDARPATTLVGGVFTDGCPDAYRQSCARNGLLDQVDAVSFHTYRTAETVEGMVRTYRDWLRESGRKSMPLWITESGRPWNVGPDRPPADQDASSALDITMKGIEARACGVAAYFPFVYVYYEENTNNFGMMGREVTPLRSMAAYAQSLTALAGKAYRGDLAADDPAIKRARVFGDSGHAVVVLYTGKAQPGATVKFSLPFTRLEGIDGRKLLASEKRSIPIPDGLTYAWVDPVKIAGVVRTDTAAARLYAVSRQPPPRRPSPSPIVLQYLFDPKGSSATTGGYKVSPEGAARFSLRVRAHNLAPRRERIELTVATPAGPLLADTGSNRKAVVQPLGWTDVVWDLDLTRLADPQGICTLIVTGQGDGIRHISPLAIDVSTKSSQPATRPK